MRDHFKTYCILLFFLLTPLLSAAAVPTTLQVVDLRGITGQPELDTWLGSLQGTLNRRDDAAAVYLIGNGQDEEIADAMIAMYHLKKEVYTPGALLATVKPSLTGQVRYDAQQPWTRNVALTAAALAPGSVIATDEDLGLPTVLDLRGRWQDRGAAYDWELTEYGIQTDRSTVVLAPESGHLLADVIAARKLLTIDLSPTEAAEAATLRKLINWMPAGGRLLGMPDNRSGDREQSQWALMQLLGTSDRTFVPARMTPNLSCLARFPITRPLMQSRDEGDETSSINKLVLIYDGGAAAIDGSQSLDAVTRIILPMLDDPALRTLPVGLSVPQTLVDYAPGLYQLLIVRQQQTAAELIAAPNGAGWALPMAMADPTGYLQRSAAGPRDLDLASASILDVGGQQAYEKLLAGMGAAGWHGAFFRPIATKSLPDQQPRTSRVFATFSSLVGAMRVDSVASLRAALAALKQQQVPFHVLYLDLDGLPPARVLAMLPEISADFTLMTPSQILRSATEYTALLPLLASQKQQGFAKTQRLQPTLQVSAPTTTLAAPTAADPIPVRVSVRGAATVLVARLVYDAPDGRYGAVDLRDAGNGIWQATVPPTLVGGALSICARVVETGGLGVTYSPPLTIKIPTVDTDEDGAEDTLEEYQGSDPANWDTDGDGLPDGYDANPTQRNRDTAPLMPAIIPPADKSFLPLTGTSTADANGRTIPAGESITYHLPLKDRPAAPSALRLTVSGVGAAVVNTGASVALNAANGVTTCEAPVTAIDMSGDELLVKLTAGDRPLRVLNLRLITNPDGPYILPARLTPAAPPAGMPIAVSAIVYSPRPLKAVRLRYGNDLAHMTALDMKLVAGSSGVHFTEKVPAQSNGDILYYHIEAEDIDGHQAASPYQAASVGLISKHNVALHATRDLTGAWDPAPIWNGLGRALWQGAGQDTGYFRARTGTYQVWLLAQPRERGINVHLRQVVNMQEVNILNSTVQAGGADGWYHLGSFKVKQADATGYKIAITPEGDAGYCAYGALIFTQDSAFTPPLENAVFDWYNSLHITGLSDGDTVGRTITLQVAPVGNIDAVRVTATQKTTADGRRDLTDHDFRKQRDGSYQLDTRGLAPGEYEITVSGMKIFVEDGIQKALPLVTTVIRVMLPVKN